MNHINASSGGILLGFAELYNSLSVSYGSTTALLLAMLVAVILIVVMKRA
ncbi:hypothetical protein [Acinetobacter indicus]|nr:hypothetical protein [Acinetobacter indicus]